MFDYTKYTKGKHGDYPASWDNPERILLEPETGNEVSDSGEVFEEHFLTAARLTELCETVNQHISQVTNLIREEFNTMLPTPTASAATKATSTNNSRGSGPKKVFINVEMLKAMATKEKPLIATIIGANAETASNRYNDVVMKLKVGMTTLWYGVKANNPNFARLVDGLSQDEEKWKGREISMYTEFDEYHERDFVHVDTLPEKTSARKK